MTVLIKYEAARFALQAAVNVDEVKDIRDKAAAMAAYAKQARDTELVEWATEIRVRAERRAGQLLAEVERDKGGRGKTPATMAGVYKDNNIPPTTGKRWQKLAAIDEVQFEQAVAAAKEVAHEVTTAAILRNQSPQKPPAAPKADPRDERIAALESQLETATENLPELANLAASAEVFKANDEFSAMVALRAELDSTRRRRDELMNENAEMRKTIAYWRKRAEKAEK